AGAPVLTGDDRVRADLPAALPEHAGPISVSSVVIGFTAFTAVFVLTGTVTLGVRQRLRELALLRTLGATPRRLRRLLGAESALLAVAAALPAVPLGVVLAHVVAARLQALGLVPAQFTVAVGVPVLLLAVLAGTLLTVTAARLAGRRAVRIAPTQALTETATAPTGGLVVRALVAAVTVAGAFAVLAFVPLDGPMGMGMTFISSALLLCAVAALGPVLVRALTALVSRPFGLAGLLSRAESRRVAAVAVPLVLMFALNATVLLNSSLLERLAGQEQVARTAAATVRVTAPGGMPLAGAERLLGLPGVSGAAATIPTRVIAVQDGRPEDFAAQGLLTGGEVAVLDLALSGDPLGDDAFAASAYLVGQNGWRTGEVVPLWLPDGHRAELRLAATYTRARGFGDLVLPAALVAAHDPAGLVGSVVLRGDVTEHLHRAWPALHVAPTAEVAPAGNVSRQGPWELLVAISLGFTAVAVVNTSAIATAARRREFAHLRLAGATNGQVHRLAGHEAVITVLVGLLIGAAVTTTVVATFSTAQDGVLRLVVAPGTYATVVGLVAALGLVAGTLPARLVLRPRSTAVQAAR
ncbi:ABC transporter permease, partial [Kineococcus glutinatus]|uniref:ABC transporter permease n=1 Tax=Kineococcus glutinatus TaxID=1070872 RepID=UPI0031F144D5